MLKKWLLITMIFAAHAVAAPPANQAPVKKGITTSPCDHVKQACLNSGFTEKSTKSGKRLWVDCVKPIMQKSNAVLPRVDPSIVAACKAKNPNFGN